MISRRNVKETLLKQSGPIESISASPIQNREGMVPSYSGTADIVKMSVHLETVPANAEKHDLRLAE